MKRILANLVDQVIVFGASAALVGLSILILKVIGFVFAEGIKGYVYLITLAVVSLLYYPIVESTKLNKTVGKKAFGI
jgi:uncharacterized RDD family membrane protein YckC